MALASAPGILINENLPANAEEILTAEALEFVAFLQREFGSQRHALLQKRTERQAQIDSGEMPDFLHDTRSIREDSSWKVGSIPADLQNRRVEITGPVERKMMINAFNSGAEVFMADFEDANSPTWENVVQGQINLRDAIDRTISLTTREGKQYRLKERIATLVVRPRGWHLDEKHMLVDGKPVSASLFDAAIYFFHNARRLIERGSGPYYYIPKLENHLEARLWNDVFVRMQDRMQIPRGTIKVTVLIETILAAFEMEEILYELRDHIAGLNAGRWDYIFSIIKTFRARPEFLFPDRGQITMTVPFMRAYTDLLVKTCHKRGAHAIGGMAAYIPSRKDPEVNERALAKVREDKERECKDGFDGTWVAHPDLVPVAREPFDRVLGDTPHQKGSLREDVKPDAKRLVDFRITDGKITEEGVRNNISVALQYLESWLMGTGAAAIFNLMEDAATAEISRSQLWQWVHHKDASLQDGRKIDKQLYQTFAEEEFQKIRQALGESRFASGRFDVAKELLDRLILSEDFAPFLTLLAYERLD